MRLYSGASLEFIEDTVQNRIADKLRSAFMKSFRYPPANAEVSSWRNSLRAISSVIEHAGLTDHGVILEYQLPLTSKRLDFLICGQDETGADQATIVELKQWERSEGSDTEGTVITHVGGAPREVLHPAVQVAQYAMYLQDYHTAFYGKNPIGLSACSYLHNYSFANNDPLLSPKFGDTILSYPLFSEQDVTPLRHYLTGRLSGGKGEMVLGRIEKGELRPSKKLMEHVESMIRGHREYILLDEQLVVYQRVLASATQEIDGKKKTAVLIRGGPGTGKSVIAINLMADLLSAGRNAHYATGSRAFTETLRSLIGRRGSIQFKYFNSYSAAGRNEVDVLIADEAHRIRETSGNRFTPKEHRTTLPQIDELLNAAKTSVFFIDDHQVVRPGEVGSSDLIIAAAKRKKCELHEYRLEAQFRCSGSDAFVNWVNNTLGVEKTANILWTGEEKFEFRIFSGPAELERAIKGKVAHGHTGRVVAGFCWEWSQTKPDGTLKDDVVIGNWKRPWNARPEARRLAPGIPKAVVWAHESGGIDQVGCVYTAQGFEFDYVGVIFGKDLRYDLDKQEWIGDRSESHDNVVRQGGERFVDLVKNTYRVLLSRGLKGCYVCFLDKDTERFFRSRIETRDVKDG